MGELNEQAEVVETEVSPPPLSLIARITNIFSDPRKTFVALEKKPDFLVPLLLVVLTAFIFTYIAWPVIEQSSQEISRTYMENKGMSEEQIETALQQQQKYGKIGGVFGLPITTVIMTLLVSAILLFAGNIILGGNAKFKQIFSLYCYGSLIDIIAYAVRMVLILLKDDIRVYTSLAALLPPDSYKEFWFKLANIADVFVIWKVVVIAIGMSVFYRIPIKKPLITVSLLYVVFGLVSMSFSR